jgi:two-component system OmpR family response regulator
LKADTRPCFLQTKVGQACPCSVNSQKRRVNGKRSCGSLDVAPRDARRFQNTRVGCRDAISATQALATYLSLEGMECEAAFGGHAAVPVATEFRPHVIIMDISMPDCDGYQAALALRGDARTKEVAIVAFTAFDEAELRQHVLDHEFDAYYHKGRAPSRLATLFTLFAH